MWGPNATTNDYYSDLVMNIEDLRGYCLSLPGASECFPFDEVTLVFKVGGKMFALTYLDGELQVNLKCNPEMAVDLREQYADVLPGYHMSKKHWNTVIINGSIPDSTINQWVKNSFDLVFASLPKSQQQKIIAEQQK